MQTFKNCAVFLWRIKKTWQTQNLKIDEIVKGLYWAQTFEDDTSHSCDAVKKQFLVHYLPLTYSYMLSCAHKVNACIHICTHVCVFCGWNNGLMVFCCLFGVLVAEFIEAASLFDAGSSPSSIFFLSMSSWGPSALFSFPRDDRFPLGRNFLSASLVLVPTILYAFFHVRW